MKLIKIILLLFTVSIVHVQGHTAFWENAFRTPSDDVRVGTFWYWVSDNISCEGVVADLNAMKKAGINLAFIGFIGPSTHHNANYPYGKVKFMSEEYGKSFRISVAHLLKLQMVSNAILRWMKNIPRFSPIRSERSHL